MHVVNVSTHHFVKGLEFRSIFMFLVIYGFLHCYHNIGFFTMNNSKSLLFGHMFRKKKHRKLANLRTDVSFLHQRLKHQKLKDLEPL